MSKYLRTLKNIDNLNRKVVLKINKCNDCPIMKYDGNNGSVRCRKFKNNITNDDIINDFVLSIKTNHGIELETINIPIWCGLDGHITTLEESEITYYITDKTVMISYGNKERNLPLYDAGVLNKFTKNNKTKIQNNIFNDVVKSNIREVEEEEDYDDDFDNIILKESKNVVKNKCSSCGLYAKDYKFWCESCDEEDVVIKTPNNFRIKEEECSCCGGTSSKVIRTENNGMCEECIELYKDDENMIKQAIINNFRLKRGVKNPINKKFKLI